MPLAAAIALSPLRQPRQLRHDAAIRQMPLLLIRRISPYVSPTPSRYADYRRFSLRRYCYASPIFFHFHDATFVTPYADTIFLIRLMLIRCHYFDISLPCFFATTPLFCRFDAFGFIFLRQIATMLPLMTPRRRCRSFSSLMLFFFASSLFADTPCRSLPLRQLLLMPPLR